MRIAILSDIHANIWALEAVLDDVKARGVTIVVNLGDILYGPLKPRATYERLAREDIALTIRGNQDRQIFDATDADLAANPTLRYVVSDLGPEPIAWMRALPPAAELEPDVFLCHGSPASDSVYLLEDVTRGHPRVRPEAEIRGLLGPLQHPLIACGHTHISRSIRLSTGQLVVNPGSVGLPAYSDDLPIPHAMETYSPDASYAIVEKTSRGWQSASHRVAYQHERAAEQASALGRMDWAAGLATGRALGGVTPRP